jgi:RES domain-containing protein
MLPDSARLARVRGLSAHWTRDKAATRSIGNRWYDSMRSAGLIVPSALCAEAHNVLINPLHPEASGIRMVVIRRFEFDRRLLRAR